LEKREEQNVLSGTSAVSKKKGQKRDTETLAYVINDDNVMRSDNKPDIVTTLTNVAPVMTSPDATLHIPPSEIPINTDNVNVSNKTDTVNAATSFNEIKDTTSIAPAKSHPVKKRIAKRKNVNCTSAHVTTSELKKPSPTSKLVATPNRVTSVINNSAKSPDRTIDSSFNEKVTQSTLRRSLTKEVSNVTRKSTSTVQKPGSPYSRVTTSSKPRISTKMNLEKG